MNSLKDQQSLPVLRTTSMNYSLHRKDRISRNLPKVFGTHGQVGRDVLIFLTTLRALHCLSYICRNTLQLISLFGLPPTHRSQCFVFLSEFEPLPDLKNSSKSGLCSSIPGTRRGNQSPPATKCLQKLTCLVFDKSSSSSWAKYWLLLLLWRSVELVLECDVCLLSLLKVNILIIITKKITLQNAIHLTFCGRNSAKQPSLQPHILLLWFRNMRCNITTM